MSTGLYEISVFHLFVSLAPILLVALIAWKWRLTPGTFLYATLRMLGQLVLAGFLLAFIFEQRKLSITLSLLALMFAFASWIALRPIAAKRFSIYPIALSALLLGCLPVMALIFFGVIQLTHLNEPRYVIPLAGMVIANAMNALSLSAERFQTEALSTDDYVQARQKALQTALIPITNSFFAVGIVSFPGMMTGQILSGVSPLIAVRYQIVVMAMIFGAAGLTVISYLLLMKNRFKTKAL